MSDRPNDPVVGAAWDDMREALVSWAIGLADMNAYLARKMTPIEQIAYFALLSRQNYTGIAISPQHKIGRYTVDFLVSEDMNWKHQVIVECDGHDFHERTKEQAQHDKRRDRELQALGFRVYRFTGSELWKTRGRCVTDALGLN